MEPSQDEANTATRLYDIPMDRLPPRFTVLGRWRDLLIAIRALHALVAARFPLSDGLLQLSQDAPNRALWHIFYWLHRELQGGVPLHVAMGNRPEFFPAFCVDLVCAGEESGQLEAALDDLQQEIADGLEFRRGVLWQFCFLGNALIMPSILVAGVMIFVAPQFEAIFTPLGEPNSPLLDWALTLHHSGVTLLMVALAFLLPALWLALETSFIRGGYFAGELGKLSSWIPGLGGHLRKRHLAGASSMLGRLLRAGAPLPAALRTAAGASSAALCANSFQRLADAVEAGETLKDSMYKERWVLPASFRTFVALGESSGQLPDALRSLAARYRTQSRTATRLVVEIGVPLLICLNGFMVFLVYGGLLTPIMRLASSID